MTDFVQDLAGTTRALDVFIHVPKTAGSTVNRHLALAGLHGQDHIEQWLRQPEKAQTAIPYLDWVSGHVNFPTMSAFLSQSTRRPLRYFSILRDPINQVRSHYNWLIEIFHRGGAFYDSHPDVIKKISERIRSTNNENPRDIIENLSRNPGLFLNQQSRIAIGEDVLKMSRTEISEKLSLYEFIGTEHSLGRLIERMTGNGTQNARHENKSTYHFDPEIFAAPEIVAFLAQENNKDQLLYDIVRSRGD